MKTVVITGSTRGLGFEMAKLFRQNGWNLVINGVNPARLEKAVAELYALPGAGAVEGFAGSVASADDLRALCAFAAERFTVIDVWINNAGVNQPMKAVWELSGEEIDFWRYEEAKITKKEYEQYSDTLIYQALMTQSQLMDEANAQLMLSQADIAATQTDQDDTLALILENTMEV